MSDIAEAPNPITQQAQTAVAGPSMGARFAAFQQKEATAKAPAPEAKETPNPTPPATEQKPAPETKVEAKTSTLLPSEKTAPKEPSQLTEKKPDPTPEKKGADGLTKEERAELVRFKKEAERVSELEEKVKTFEATQSERDELKRRYTELEERAKVYEAKATAFDVRNSTHFQETVDKPMKILVHGMDDLCQKNNLNADEVYQAIWAPNETDGNVKLAEFLGSMDGFTTDKFKRMVNDMRDLGRKAQELTEKAPEAWSAIQAEEKKRKEEALSKSKETYRLANEAVFHGDGKEAGLKDRFPFLKDTPEGQQVLTDAIAVDFDTMPPGTRAYYAQAGQAALHFNRILQAKETEIAQLKEALKKEGHVARPSDGNKPLEEAKSEADPYAGMTTGQRMAAYWKDSGGFSALGQ